jgi:hypothetical protein
LSDGDSTAVAISEEGWIVGSSTAAEKTRHPVLWKPDLSLVDLGLVPGLSDGSAVGINERGEVLVNFQKPNIFFVEEAYLWTEKGGYSALQRPTGCEDLSGIRGVAINNRGEILLNVMVGSISNDPRGPAFGVHLNQRAFLFSGGRLKELLPPPRSGRATYTYTSLNDLGWLVGYVQLKNSDPTSWRGFLARPFK